ncbi:DNA-directed RNA polymerase subunit alpha [Candidatus Dojkabacteria bacterium]|nr:DNA-directed RNA polymerase subunit alpha [Candidatus Dojkabacteria bacterium]
MIDLNDIKVETKEETENHGVYVVAPLPRGYGHTLVNPLRRVLLSSLEGSGITSVKIDGIKHEYSTIEGVREDVLEILLNLKALKFKCTSDEPQVCYIEAKGKTEVAAGDIKITQSVQLVDKDAPIANLTDKSSELKMEIVIEKGVGYRDSDENQRSEVGRIPLDADFSPVEKVKFEVGKARKGQETELDSVTMEITTDGSISPKDALLESAKILQEYSGKVMVALGMSKLEVEELADESSEIIEEVSEEEDTDEEEEVLDWKIEDQAISKRAKTALLNAGYETLGELVELSEKELKKLSGFGAKSLSEVVMLLEEYGIKLPKDSDE